MKNKGYLLLFIFSYIFFIIIIFVNIGLSQDDAAGEIASYIQNESGNKVTVYIAPNSKTKKGDIYIKVITPKSPSKDKTILSIVYTIGKLMEESIAYRIYFDTVMIEINDRLYAIGTTGCRAVFNAKSREEQGKIVQNSLKTLK